MSDENDLELRFGADASGVETGAQATNEAIASIGETMAALSAAMTAQTEAIVEGFKQMAEASAETRGELEKDFEQEEEGILGVVAGVREGVESFGELRESIMGFGELLLAAFAVEEISEFIEKMGEAGEQVEHTAQFFGLTIAQVQQLQGAFTAAGAGPEALGIAMRQLERSSSEAVSGTQKAADAYKLLGVDLTIARTPADLLKATLEGFSNLPGPERAAVAITVFGRSALNLAGVIGASKDKLEEFLALPEKYGAQWPEAAEKAAKLGEAVNENKLAGQGWANVMADALAPVLTNVVQGFTRFVVSLTDSYRQGGLVKQVMDDVALTIQVLVEIIGTIGDVATAAFAALTGGADGSKEALSSLGQVISGIGEAVAVMGMIIETTMDKTSALVDGVITRFRQLGNVMQDIALLRFDKIAGDYTYWENQIKAVGAAELKLEGQQNANFDARMARLEALGKKIDEVKAKEEEKPEAGTPVQLGGEKKEKDTGQEDALSKAREAFEAQEAAFRGMIRDMTADELAFWQQYQKSAEYAGLTDKEQGQVRLNIAKLERQEDLAQINDTIAAKKNAAAEAIADIQTELQANQAAAAQKIATIEASEKEGLVSRRSALAQIKEILEEEFVAATSAADRILLQRTSVDEAIKAVSATTTEAYKAAQADEVKANAERNKAVQTAENSLNKALTAASNQAAEEQAAAFKKMFTSIGDFGRTTIAGLIEGTESWSQVWNRVLDGALNLFLQFCEKQLVQWAEKWALQAGLDQTYNAIMQALGLTTAATTAATSATTSITQISNAAAVGAANAFAATAAIPIVGPELAPAAAAVADTSILSLISQVVASAAGGYDIPAGINPITQLHAEEMVLPADIATPLRGALRNGGSLASAPTASSLASQSASSYGQTSQAQGGTINLSVIDKRGVQQLLIDNSDTLADIFAGRNRSMKGRSPV